MSRAVSSVGRAPALQAGGRRFEPVCCPKPATPRGVSAGIASRASLAPTKSVHRIERISLCCDSASVARSCAGLQLCALNDPQSPGRRRFPTKRQRRPLRIFLSYRREDASGHAGRLYDLLAARYGTERVFMDIDAIPLGSEFAETINRAVASCDVLIALMGRDWLEAKDSDGYRRLDDPDDFVRRELESNMRRASSWFPPWCRCRASTGGGASVFGAALTRRRGFQLSDTGWRDDVGRLIRSIGGVGGRAGDPAAADATTPSRRPPRRRTVAALLLLGWRWLPRSQACCCSSEAATTRHQGASRRGTNRPGSEQLQLGSDLRTSPTKGRWAWRAVLKLPVFVRSTVDCRR